MEPITWQDEADVVVIEGLKLREGVAEFCESRPILRHKVPRHRFRVVLNVVFEIKAGIGRQFAEEFEYAGEAYQIPSKYLSKGEK